MGRESNYGIFKDEFLGLILALRLAYNPFGPITRQIRIVLENQGVVRDMATKNTSLRALSQETNKIDLIKWIEGAAPQTKITLRWCPGHEGLEGNKQAEKLANTTARKPLPGDHSSKPTFSSFRAVVKD